MCPCNLSDETLTVTADRANQLAETHWLFNKRKEPEGDLNDIQQVHALPPIPMQPTPTITSTDANCGILHELLVGVQGLEDTLRDARKTKEP